MYTIELVYFVVVSSVIPYPIRPTHPIVVAEMKFNFCELAILPTIFHSSLVDHTYKHQLKTKSQVCQRPFKKFQIRRPP